MKREELRQLRPVNDDEPFLAVTRDHLQIAGYDQSAAIVYAAIEFKARPDSSSVIVKMPELLARMGGLEMNVETARNAIRWLLTLQVLEEAPRLQGNVWVVNINWAAVRYVAQLGRAAARTRFAEIRKALKRKPEPDRSKLEEHLASFAEIRKATGSTGEDDPPPSCGNPQSDLRKTRQAEAGNPQSGSRRSADPYIGSKNTSNNGSKNTATAERRKHGERGTGTAADAGLKAGLHDAETQWQFEHLQQLVSGEVLKRDGRLRILAAGARFGFVLAELGYAFSKLKGRLKLAGGLILFAENWPEESAPLRTWPACRSCYGRGAVFFAGSPFWEGAPCECLNPEEAATRFRGFDDWKAHSLTGVLCEGCGRNRFFDPTAGRWCCECEVLAVHERVAAEQEEAGAVERTRAEAKAEAERAAAAERRTRQAADEAAEARRLDLEAQHICPDCEGSGGKPKGGRCLLCKGTGQYFTDAEWAARGRCSICCGTGTFSKGGKCSICRGSGDCHAGAELARTSKMKPGSEPTDAAIVATGAA